MDWHERTGRLTDPPGDEFKTWVTVKEAFSHLVTGVDRSLSDALLHRLKTGMLFGAATTSKWVDDGSRNLTKYITAIDPTWWGNVDGGRQDHYDRLWKHGDISLIVPNRGDGTNTLVHFFDVRFEWSGLHEIVQPPYRLKPLDRPAPELPLTTFVQEPLDLTGLPMLYDNWRTPQEALADLGSLGRSKAVRQILIRLFDAKMRSIARDVRYFDIDKAPATNQVLDKAMWLNRDPETDNAAHDFWDTGVATFLDSPDNDGCRAYEVRFHPDDVLAILPRSPRPSQSTPAYTPRPIGTLEQIAPELATYRMHPTPTITPNEDVAIDFQARTAPELLMSGLESSAPQRKRVNPMTNGEIKTWYRGLSPAQKTLGVPALWDLAQQENPGRHLPRKLVEQFGKDRTNAHRAKPESPKTRRR